ncbi:MarR family transcriptional regulator [Saccharopolyspora indica]|uniref:MarR family winged helix-turn-helix transcriptional regulator n=1 Tax=Saccharopolyspora indica TaxID=1229659 RepID=UPI0022EA912B|nr:MarR family transcriptional regulator [Saccharopolyspora indica]MDA3647649.1 MarR family transcriptional regulator [Saccharopolyspora indica]
MAGNRRRSTAAADGAVRRLDVLGRDLAAATVAFHTEVAERLGLSVTDHKCLDLIQRSEGEMTAGRLAELSGLSTGTVTGVIDRLERAGYVVRVRDERDRRKVLVELVDGDADELTELFAGLHRRVVKTVRKLGPAEREVVESYLSEMIDALRAETAELRG